MGGGWGGILWPSLRFQSPAEVMGVLGIMRVGQYQAVKAFGDKPRLMTRKSVVALICAGPLAHRRKAASYTKETPNLLRNMLNIPPLLGGLKGKPKTVLHPSGFPLKNQPQACIPFFVVVVVGLEGKTLGELEGKEWGFWSGCSLEEDLLWSQCKTVSAKLEPVITGAWEISPHHSPRGLHCLF